MIDMKKVLVVVAHPDDEVLGCGGTIHKLLGQGAKVRVVVLGEGSSCRFSADQLGSELVKTTIKQRQSFAEEALATLGVSDYAFGDLPCGRFDTCPMIDIGKKIEAEIAEFDPDTVFTHSGGDTNSDHRITFNAMLIATRPVPGNNVRTLLSCEIPSSTEWRFVETFTPNFFVDLDESNLDAKVRAFDCYVATEGRPFPFPRCDVGLRTLAAYRGMQVGVNAAEAFQIVRSTST